MLLIYGIHFTSYDKSCLSGLGKCNSSISSFVPWSLLARISTDKGDVVTAAQLKAILRMAYNAHTLIISDRNDILSRAMFLNTDLGTPLSEQVSVSILKKKFH